MQTFLPYSDFNRSVACLDRQRLCKQRLEALQIYKIVSGITPNSGWCHHPAVKMWVRHEYAILSYLNTCIREWTSRGYENNIPILHVPLSIPYPKWIGLEVFHASHRSNLLRKDPIWYSQFGWTEPNNLPYYWPRVGRSWMRWK